MNSLHKIVELLQFHWAVGLSPDLGEFLARSGEIAASSISRLARIDQTERWLRNERPSSEEYFSQWPVLHSDQESAIDLIYHEYLLRIRLGEQPELEDFISRFPAYAAALKEQISFHTALNSTDGAIIDDRRDAGPEIDPHPRELPTQFGRYQVLRRIGSGGMGIVYEALDTELDRRVALKLSRFRGRLSFGPMERLRREARIAATFRHPNLCPVYDIGELDGVVFITMPLVEGHSLAQQLKQGPLPHHTALQIALKTARAVSIAHAAGVVHRDLKPANILLATDQEPIVVDFGLARQSIDAGVVGDNSELLAGTLAYMAPEQLVPSNADVGPPCDIYTLGATLFEMLTGRPPFNGDARHIFEQIQTSPPPKPSSYVANLSSAVDAICQRALAKEPNARFKSMEELANALEAIVSAKHRRTRVFISLLAAIVTLGGSLSWRMWDQAWARQQLPVVERLVHAGKMFEAYDLARRVRQRFPADPKVARLMSVVADTLTVTSQPEGAKVFVERLVAENESRVSAQSFVGTTPLRDFEVARDSYLITVEKEGYAVFQRSWTGAWSGPLNAPVIIPPIPIDITLTPETEQPPDMVAVPGGDYRLMSWDRPTDEQVTLGDFFIDKTEVTNDEYQTFVDAGGYTTAKYWTRSFVDNGKTIPWREAISRFKDQTGQPGPRQWSQGRFPPGHGDFPVTGVAWYEAAAYAEFRGKSLPTIFQWEKAARFRWQHPALTDFNNPMGVTMPWGLHEGSVDRRANFDGTSPVSTGRFPFGMSPYGCLDMAGNVSEWCLNENSDGFFACGGSWASIPTAWGLTAKYPGFHGSDQIGFRCVSKGTSTDDQGASWVDVEKEVPQFTPKPFSEVAPYFSYFNYPPTSLESRVIHIKTTDDWRRETIEYQGADGETTLAYLYLPRQGPSPFPVLHVVPAGDVFYRIRTVPESIEATYVPFLQAGRAVFAVVLRGFLERDYPPDRISPRSDSIEHAEMMAQHVKDLRRGLDYLQMRKELDLRRIAYITTSNHGLLMTLPAIEARYQAAIFVGDGVYKWEQNFHPIDNGVNLAPLITIPKLMVNGMYDENAPWTTAGEPLFNLLTEPKEKHLYHGAHIPQSNELATVVNKWLAKLSPGRDETRRETTSARR